MCPPLVHVTLGKRVDEQISHLSVTTLYKSIITNKKSLLFWLSRGADLQLEAGFPKAAKLHITKLQVQIHHLLRTFIKLSSVWKNNREHELAPGL